MRTIFVFAAVVLFLGACGRNVESAGSCKVIDIENAPKAKCEIKSEGKEIVALETTDNSLIKTVTSLFVTDEYIIVFDSGSHRILQFDRKGKFIRCMSRQGRGPKEIPWFAEAIFHDNLLYVLGMGKLLVFNMAGDVVRSIALDNFGFNEVSIAVSCSKCIYTNNAVSNQLLNGDNAVVGDLIHGICDERADELVAGGHSAHAGDVVGAVDLLALGADGGNGGLHGLGHTLLHHDGVGAGGQVLQTLADDGLSQQGGGGGTVAGHVVGLGGNFLHQLSAHVLKGIFQFDLLGDGHAVVGDEGSAVLLVKNYVSALGAESDLNSISELINAAKKGVSGINSVVNILCHCD